ncbi:MAG: nucleotidyltransferase family protein [Zhaonellaceae bacterium]|jgi:predicted nucleotidyltransferase|nr:nucleotidyltransferase domain-containing protein [Clostridia bacterium]
MISIDKIRSSIENIACKYPIKKISLFGSYADNTATDSSDIDLLIEFFPSNVSLFTLYNIKCEIEEKLQKKVDLIHAPVEKDSLLHINRVVDIYEQ